MASSWVRSVVKDGQDEEKYHAAAFTVHIHEYAALTWHRHTLLQSTTATERFQESQATYASEKAPDLVPGEHGAGGLCGWLVPVLECCCACGMARGQGDQRFGRCIL